MREIAHSLPLLSFATNYGAGDRAGHAAGACTASMGCVHRRNGFCVWQSECVESCVHAGQPLQEDPRKQALLLILRQRFTDVNRWNGWTADAPSALYELNEKLSC